ncbi:MAG: hypothetical protein ACK52I_22255 [Pseudomonadota bacterium]|jgi:hypothetical protein
MPVRNQIIAQQISSFHQVAQNFFLIANNAGNTVGSNLLQRVSDGLTNERAKAPAFGFGGTINGIKGDNFISLALAASGGNSQGSLSQCRILIPDNKQVNIVCTVFGRSNPLGEYYTAKLEYNFKRVAGVVTGEGAPVVTDQGLLKTNYNFALTLIDIGGGEIGYRAAWTAARPAVELYMTIEYFFTA